jgi:predicted nucleic acid-binding protein
MKKLKIYLDTSVINYLFSEDAPEAKQITNNFFEFFIKPRVYETYISPIVINEINNTSDENKKAILLSIIPEYEIQYLDILTHKTEIEALAEHYLEKGILPRKSLFDALHIAICTFHEIDALISWNYKHMANIHRERKITSLNLNEGYLHTLRICTPMEVMDEND